MKAMSVVRVERFRQRYGGYSIIEEIGESERFMTSSGESINGFHQSAERKKIIDIMLHRENNCCHKRDDKDKRLM